MTEAEALKSSSNYVDMDNLIGHFGFKAANFLVGTGKYKFWQVSWMGYVLKKKGK